MGVVDDLALAREAYERREWVAAYEALTDVEAGALTADDFERLATAAYLLGRRNDCVQALQRAYQVEIDGGDAWAAVRTGSRLAVVLLMIGEPAVAGGWISRSQRRLDELAGADADVAERGHLHTALMLRSIFSGELERALALAVEVTDCGRRHEEADMVAQGLNGHGRILLYVGRVPEGLALLDEAMAEVSTGRVSPVFAGEIYCSLIEACREISDYGRAAEWTRALTTWFDAQPGLVAFAGQCAVHRGQLMRVRGAFREALDEFARSVDRYLAAETPAPAGLSLAESGDVLRILGDLDGAEAAYEKAIGYGHEPQPGLALLWLARGRTAAALNSVRRLLTEPRGPVQRSQLLPGAAEVLAVAGDPDAARAVADELVSLADSFDCAALRAMGHQARGRCLTLTAEPAAAVTELRLAESLFRTLEVPYEVARCQTLLAVAFRDLGDEDSALAHLSHAGSTFRDLGALPAERAAERLASPSHPAGLTEREVEVLRLVANGRSNADIATALVLSEKTVARHLSNIFAKLGVSSRTAAAAFAYEHRLL